uniref:Uncharacterized protein n=1 Tax=Amphimedon queenslandica TaxID=400682 RepID=A0A1X7TN62_AMPQE
MLTCHLLTLAGTDALTQGGTDATVGKKRQVSKKCQMILTHHLVTPAETDTLTPGGTDATVGEKDLLILETG